jgi:hypothetical protein
MKTFQDILKRLRSYFSLNFTGISSAMDMPMSRQKLKRDNIMNYNDLLKLK